MTKRVICCVIIVTMLGLLLGRCNGEKKINQQKEANLILGNLITALENSNIEELYISKCHSDSFSGIECLAQVPAMKKIKLPEGILSESDKRLLVEKGVELSVYN